MFCLNSDKIKPLWINKKRWGVFILGLGFWVYLLGFLVLMWLLFVLPQRKREKQRQSLLSSLEVGDRVVTLGGVHGKITRLKDKTIFLEVAPGVEIELEKTGVAYVRASANDEEEDWERDGNEGLDDEEVEPEPTDKR